MVDRGYRRRHRDSVTSFFLIRRHEAGASALSGIVSSGRKFVEIEVAAVPGSGEFATFGPVQLQVVDRDRSAD